MNQTEEPHQSIPWWKKAVFYQIYPLSFMDSNGDGKGDIPGIISKLDYLNDGTPNSLGIDAIWLSPVYPSPNKDWGYDNTDHKSIDPSMGTMDDFKTLLKEAHDRNIRIVMDLVMAYTSDQHPWFIEARKSKDNPKHDWYLWHPGKKGKPPNNWFAAFDSQAWWWEESCQEYYFTSFTRYQPDVNWRNPELASAMYDIVRFWMDIGVDGFRMDVANYYFKDEDLRNNPYHFQLNPPDYQRHLYDRNRSESHKVCKAVRKILDEYPHRMAVGEIYTDDPTIAAQYYGNGDELHLNFNFAFGFCPWKASCFHRNIEEWEGLLKDKGWPVYTLSNHDDPKRHISRYARGKHTQARAKVAAAMLLTLRGSPFLYYGEEIGMTNRKMKKKELCDPMGEKYWPFLVGRDPGRTPMQWNSSAKAGFSTANPWIPVNDNYHRINVDQAKNDPQSLLSFYRKMIDLRKKIPALQYGNYRSLIDSPKAILAYERWINQDRIAVFLNFKRSNRTLSLKDHLSGKILLSTHRKENENIKIPGIKLYPNEVLIIKIP